MDRLSCRGIEDCHFCIFYTIFIHFAVTGELLLVLKHSYNWKCVCYSGRISMMKLHTSALHHVKMYYCKPVLWIYIVPVTRNVDSHHCSTDRNISCLTPRK